MAISVAKMAPTATTVARASSTLDIGVCSPEVPHIQAFLITRIFPVARWSGAVAAVAVALREIGCASHRRKPRRVREPQGNHPCQAMGA